MIQSGQFDPSRQRALGSILLEYLLNVSRFLSLQDLEKYCQTLKQARIETGQWCPGLDLSSEALIALADKKFSSFNLI